LFPSPQQVVESLLMEKCRATSNLRLTTAVDKLF
jgi:hypothetical protein